MNLPDQMLRTWTCEHESPSLCFFLLLFLPYMFSNWSTLLLVLPFLTSLRVLYLSLPCFTFSLWIRSIVVSPVSSLEESIPYIIYCRIAKNDMCLVAAENNTAIQEE